MKRNIENKKIVIIHYTYNNLRCCEIFLLPFYRTRYPVNRPYIRNCGLIPLPDSAKATLHMHRISSKRTMSHAQ